MAELFANSGDPDQMLHSVASDLGLHCLPFTLLGVSRLQCVYICCGTHWKGCGQAFLISTDSTFHIFFSYFPIKTYVVSTLENDLGKALLMSTHNIFCNGEVKIIYCWPL